MSRCWNEWLDIPRSQLIEGRLNEGLLYFYVATTLSSPLFSQA